MTKITPVFLCCVQISTQNIINESTNSFRSEETPIKHRIEKHRYIRCIYNSFLFIPNLLKCFVYF